MTTKVGLLVECGRNGLEHIVCRRLCELIATERRVELAVEIVPMDKKARLLEECGTVTRALLATGCELVVILWDERPAWPDTHERLCWRNDREHALIQLRAARLPQDKTHLVCIEREFESWLLFDHKMLECVLSTPNRSVRVPKQKSPHRHANPKGLMMSLFRKLAGKAYIDVQYSRRIAACLTALGRLRKCSTFRRFEARIAGTT